jgi:hypothetical protein
MKTAVCIASGPSLTQEDVNYCRGKAKVYVVNDCYKLAPWADVLYACDLEWWNHHKGVPDFKGEKWTLTQAAAKKYSLNFINVLFNTTWSFSSDFVASGGNSGFQCLNLAVNQGAERVILLGYDMKSGIKKHWFGDHPGALNRGSNYTSWIKHFVRATEFIPANVINCTRDTALHCFPRKNLRDVL